MKRLLTIALCALCLLLCFSACEDEKRTVSVQYLALEGGTIVGVANQQKDVDDSGVARFDSVTAVPNEGYSFVKWSDGSTEPTRCDSLSSSAILSASFSLNKVTLSYSCEEGGVIEGQAMQSLIPGVAGSQVTAVALEGYKFVEWSDGLKSATRYDIARENLSVSATFTDKVSFTYTAQEGGEVAGFATQEVKIGKRSALVRAVANEGYRFVKWSDGVTAETRNDLAEDDFTVSAIFQKCYKVSFLCNAEMGTIAGQATQIVDEGESSLAVIVREIEGYEFVCWSNGSTDKVMSVTPTEDTTLIAHFTRKGYGLPTVQVNTVTGGDVVSKDVYIGCTVTIHDADDDYYLLDATGQIKGRGNSTWTNFPKKPYRIKLDVSESVFGFGKAKDWVLLADHMDYSLIRNYFSYTLAGEFSELGASPDCRSVELYFNGQYRGVYLLCEQIEVDDDRVDITESVVPDTGYIIEMDQWAVDRNQGEIFFQVPDSLKSNRAYTIKAPGDEITEEQKAYIKKYIEDCISALWGNDYSRVCELMDVKSFAQAYIVYELTKNPDVDYSSFYMFKDAGSSLRCGPVWDFDMSMGNVSHKGNGKFEDPALINAKYANPYFKGLLRFDEFKALVGEELGAYIPTISEMIDEVADFALSKQSAFEQNFVRWDILGTSVWNPSYIVEIDTWVGQVEYVRTYLKASLQALIKEYIPSSPSA